MLKTKIAESSEVDITPMIDIVFQLIIFFMVVMAIAVVYGVAIKFPPPGAKGKRHTKKEKNIIVFIGSDRITANHVVVRDGILKINGEEIPLTRTELGDRSQWETVYKQWEKEREEGYDLLQTKMQEFVDKGYKTDILLIQGDMKTYHGKVMRVIDRAKRIDTGKLNPDGTKRMGIEGFSLVPPER